MNSLALILLAAVVSAQQQFAAVKLARPGSFGGARQEQVVESNQQRFNGQHNLFEASSSNSGQFQSRSDFSGSQLSSVQDRSSQFSAQVRSFDSEFPVDGVFEPFNLPSGASLLMGQIDVSFSCGDRPYGFYADEANNCQIFHVCNPYLFDDGRIETHQYSFMCGEGRVFDQSKLTCVDQFAAIPCAESSFFHSRNEEFGRPEEKVLNIRELTALFTNYFKNDALEAVKKVTADIDDILRVPKVVRISSKGLLQDELTYIKNNFKKLKYPGGLITKTMKKAKKIYERSNV
ncbi:uncharacterized protein LOC143021369 [Oratosquilla oratoria]|uniref:uncharacterized protein LOC143021369 n=1 Tax=Oratosquilla oratoria TaxID=337810 RepID=UPI003F773CCA